MNRILSIDPGKNSGVAVFEEQGGFWGLSSASIIPADNIAYHCRHPSPGPYDVDVLIIEHPVVQMGDLAVKGRGELLRFCQDLSSVNVIEGLWIQGVAAAETIQVEPHTWKGSVPKGIHNARVLEKLNAFEKGLVPSGALRHNAIDAIGIGLWYLESRGLR